MTIAIRLDTPALRSLIKDDAAFELDLSKAVIAQIVSRLPGRLERHVEDAMHGAIEQAFGRMRPSKGAEHRRSPVAEAVLADIATTADAHVRTATELVLREALQKAHAAVEERVAQWSSGIDAAVERRVDAVVRREIETRVAARLAEVAAAISPGHATA